MFATLDGAIELVDKVLFNGFLKGCGENRERKNKQLHCTVICIALCILQHRTVFRGFGL